MDATQLVNYENLCKVLYESGNEGERSHAQQAVLVLQSSAEYIPQCQYILDHSTSAYALLVASNSLTKLISSHWNNFTSAQRVDIRNYVLGYLAQKGPGLEKYVCTALIQLVCRLTKLGWFDDAQHREITQEITKFLQATVDHCIIGLQIFNELVQEMNQPIVGYTLTMHRKTAVSFRETSLYHVFQVALTTLRQLQLHNIVGATSEQENRMAEQALSLTIKCLSYDFIGTNPDESVDEAGSLQVPSTWRGIIQEPATMQLLFDLYLSVGAPTSAKCMEILMLLTSIRRSLFNPDSERSRFLTQLITGISKIISTQAGLNDHQNYHEFCRLLSRIKSNYQLSELVSTEGYREWLDLCLDFTVKSFGQWQWSSNSVPYLINFWARLVAAVPYVRQDPSGKLGPQLENYIPNMFRSYVQSRLESAEQAAMNDTLDNLLEDEGSLMEQLDKLPTICHFQYRKVGDFLVSLFDPLLQQYTELCEMSNGGMNTGNAQQQILAIEMKMAWLVYIVGGILGNHSYGSSHGDDGEEIVDADISKRVFRVMQITEHRLISSGGHIKCDLHLELSLLYYFSNFRKTYIGEQHGMPSTSSPPGNIKSLSSKHKAYLRMFEHLGLGNHTIVVNMIITKIGNNLKFWGNDEAVVGQTLTLFMDIASGYSSGKLLLGLETVQYLLGHHTADEFPFLSIPANTRHRTTFHATLSRLLFTSPYDDTLERQTSFMEPILNVLGQLLQTQNYRQEDVKQAIIGVFRDLRGVVMSTHNRRTYGNIFEMLYPTYFPVFVRAAEEWADDPAVTNALLKFMLEFSYNKAQRVMFEQSSPNGILLFRELSKVVVAYGKRVLPRGTSDCAYAEKYKGISLCLGILGRAFGGNYVNFGVFSLYNDKALENALDIALQLALSIPMSDLMSYPKVKKSFFSFLEILFRNHLVSVICLNSDIFFQLIQALHEGLNSYDLAIAAQCASAIDHLATFYYINQKKKDSPAKLALNSHLQSEPTIFATILSSLFNILIYGEATTQWALSRPILSLTLCSEEALNTYKQTIASSQSADNQSRLEEVFSNLFKDIQPNLEPANRDKFTQKLGQFRTTIRGFLTMQ